MRNVSHNRCRENQDTHFTFSSSLSLSLSLNRAVYDGRTGHRQQYSTVQAFGVQDKYGYRQALKICNNNGFSKATMVTRTPLNVTVQVNCVSGGKQ